MTVILPKDEQSPEGSWFWRAHGDTGTEVLMGRYRDFAFAPHAHDRYLIGLVTYGAIEIVDPKRRVIAEAGDVVLYNHDQIHWGHSAGEHGWAIISIYLPPEALDEVARETGIRGRGTIGFPEVVTKDVEISQRLCALADPLDLHQSLACDSHLLEITEILLSQHVDRHFSLPNVGPENRVVAMARDYLENNFAHNVSLTGLAAECGIGRYWLIKAFKAAWGVPPYAYLVNLRVRRALILLRQGMKVSEVALECGFSDQSHLTRTFKRSVGTTPGRYRAR